MSKRKKRLHRSLMKWHQRAGVGASVVVVIILITGILLNHTDHLNLDETKILYPPILSVYGLKVPKLHSYRIEMKGRQHTLNVVGRTVFFNDRRIVSCQSQYLGAHHIGSYAVVACDNKLALLDNDGAIIDILDESYDTPVPIERAFQCDDAICVSSPDGEYVFDDKVATWSVMPHGTASKPVEKAVFAVKTEAPAPIRRNVMKAYMGPGLSWERLLLDIHAGRFLGPVGPLLMDLVALATLFLVLSGVYSWVKRRPPKRR